MKKERKFRIPLAAAAVLGLCAISATGCIRQTEVPIIAEKQPSPPTGSDSLANPDSTSTDGSLPGTETQNAVEKLAEAPKRYQTNVSEEWVTIEADVPLAIPRISRVPVLEIENQPYTDEECMAAMALLTKETGVTEWVSNDTETVVGGHVLPSDLSDIWMLFKDSSIPGLQEYFFLDRSSSTASYTSSDGSYNLSFGTDRDADYTPMIWLMNLIYKDYTSNGETDASDLSEFSLSENEQAALMKELTDKSEALLKRLSLSDFYLKSAQWKKISSSETGSTEFTEKYGLRLTYIRAVEGIPLINRDILWAMKPMASCQYVQFLYMEDGTLLELKDINRERVSANLGTERFLMPFNAVAQIFEQYMKYYQTTYTGDSYHYFDAKTEAAGPQTLSAKLKNQELRISVKVTEVRFGYQLIYDDWDSEDLDKGDGKGRLVPVWAFYGVPKVSRPEDDGTFSDSFSQYNHTPPDQWLLVTVNAVDGTVYGNE